MGSGAQGDKIQTPIPLSVPTAVPLMAVRVADRMIVSIPGEMTEEMGRRARERVLDTNGAGDVFHGAYVFSYLNNAGKGWHDHFEFARAASTYKIQRLGNEAGLPTLRDIEAVRREFEVPA